ncbi:MAG: FliG C-terminal domain-containing protein [Spirochaetota bacterium]
MSDETRDALQKGRKVMKLLELHHRQQAELKKARDEIARRSAQEVRRLLGEAPAAAASGATGAPAAAETSGDAQGSATLADSDTPAIDAAARIARELPSSIRRAIETKLPPSLAEEFDAAVYAFEGLPTLAAREVQRVIHHADKRSLAIALLGASDELFHTVTSNMSSRAASMLKEDMESLLASGELSTRDVHDARVQLSSVIRASVRAE